MPIHARLTQVPGNAETPSYAQAVVASGRLAFLSGQVSVDENGELVGAGDLAEQTAQALRNLHNVLRSLGADWDNVVRLNWYILDASAITVVREVRERFFRPVLGDVVNPASTLVQVGALADPGYLIEIDAVVAVPGD